LQVPPSLLCEQRAPMLRLLQSFFSVLPLSRYRLLSVRLPGLYSALFATRNCPMTYLHTFYQHPPPLHPPPLFSLFCALFTIARVPVACISDRTLIVFVPNIRGVLAFLTLSLFFVCHLVICETWGLALTAFLPPSPPHLPLLIRHPFPLTCFSDQLLSGVRITNPFGGYLFLASV